MGQTESDAGKKKPRIGGRNPFGIAMSLAVWRRQANAGPGEDRTHGEAGSGPSAVGAEFEVAPPTGSAARRGPAGGATARPGPDAVPHPGRKGSLVFVILVFVVAIALLVLLLTQSQAAPASRAAALPPGSHASALPPSPDTYV